MISEPRSGIQGVPARGQDPRGRKKRRELGRETTYSGWVLGLTRTFIAASVGRE
jgi:hypothetical protein